VYITIIIIIMINNNNNNNSTSLDGPWPPQANVASDLCPGQPPANFYNPVSFHLPLPCQSILILVGYILVDLQGLSFFLGISFSSIHTTWSAHLSLLDFIALAICGLL
jgi:hypothetical protein